jgi:polyhydroxybutyrate depolymerase
MFQLTRTLLIILSMGNLLASCAAPATTVTSTVVPTATEAPTAIAGPTLQPTDVERNVMVNGMERSYLLHIPPGLDSLHPVPVVFAFVSSAEAAVMKTLTGYDDIADKAGFLVVYPEGLGTSWNVGGSCCGYAVENNVDDIAFVKRILADLRTVASVDVNRIYATGISQGAALAYRLACEMSNTFAAIGPVAGYQLYNPCQPEEPVSVIHVHGLADTTNPYTGGGDLGALPVEKIIAAWAQMNGCAGSPQMNKENLVTHTAYASCNAGTAVEVYTLEKGQHSWPSKYVWDASQIIWDFFAAHPKP